MIPKTYCDDVSSRSFLRYWKGWGARLLQNIKYMRARRIARRNGAKIGKGAIFSVALARKMNANVVIGAYTSIQTDSLDTRNPLHIGEYVINWTWNRNYYDVSQYRLPLNGNKNYAR